MKNLIIVLVSLCGIFYFPNAIAQQVHKARIGTVKQKNNTIEFTVTSSVPFYVGGNVYVLHIGNKTFRLSEQTSDDKNRGYLKFFIPVDEYNKLKEGNAVYLTYGYMHTNEEQEVLAVSKKDPDRCWQVGKFSKKLLTK